MPREQGKGKHIQNQKPKNKNMTKESAINEIIASGCDTNQISDGYHTFGELYEHRIRLWIELCKVIASIKPVWLSLKHSDGSEMQGWFLLGIGKVKGFQMTYHLPEKYLGELAGNPRIEILDIAPEWDGHTPADVIERLKGL